MKKIITHNGRFHADECLAVALLRKLPSFQGAEVIRTRDPAIISQGDIVVDVGGVYDPLIHRYDHHQNTFSDTFGCGHDTIKLSSAGLVYKHFGQQCIREYLIQQHKDTTTTTTTIGDSVVRLIWLKLYKCFIEPFDAVDNGIERYDTQIEPRYHKPHDIFDMVHDLNPEWNEVLSEPIQVRFEEAVSLMGQFFDKKLRHLVQSWLPARQVVETSFLLAFDKPESKVRYIIFEDTACPWKDHLFDLEQENRCQGHFLYVLYPDNASTNVDKPWRLQAVPTREGSFDLRKPMPKSWRGLRDEQLSQVCGIAGCIFVHANGFIGGNATKEGALRMVQLAITNENDL